MKTCANIKEIAPKLEVDNQIALKAPGPVHIWFSLKKPCAKLIEKPQEPTS